ITRHSWVVVLIFTHLWTSATGSLLQPYFPLLAASMGLEAWKYAFVFSAHKGSRTIATILADRLVRFWLSLLCLYSGAVHYCIFVICFRTLYWCQSGELLLEISLVLSALGGFLDGIYVVSLFTSGVTGWPQNSGMIISTLDLTWSIGHMVGSITGGFLIKLWAFPLPFFVLGTVAMFSIPLVATKKSAPIEEAEWQTAPQSEPSRTSTQSYYKLLRDPEFLIDIGSMMLSWVIMAFNEPTLQPHLAQLGMNSAEVGVVFMVQFASYTFGSLCSAILCNMKMEKSFGFVGHILTILAYILLGPAPFIPFEATCWMVYASQVSMGVGIAAQFACYYCHALKVAGKRGYPNSTRTISFVSSVVFSTLMIIAVATSPVAGYVVEKYGYRKGSMALLGVLLLWVPVTFVQWMKSICGRDRQTEQKQDVSAKEIK
ncbi:unnamed protein product, partial [Ixodes hexagonus]